MGNDAGGGERKGRADMVSDFNWIKRMLSHNVRMPVAVITGYGELLRQGLLSPAEQEKAILDICDNITYINELLCMVLECGEQEGQAAERVELAGLLERMRRYAGEAAKRDDIEISVRTEKPEMYVHASPLGTMRVLYQLFENAVKYMEGGSRITIQAYYVEQEQVLLVFKNDGKGMPEKEARHVFERGFRGSNSKGRAGSGHGLAEVKRIMESCGGSAEAASSEAAGFSVFLMFMADREKGG